MAKLKKLLICPDAHHPYVDRKAWGLFLKAGKLFKPDILVIMGDFMDFYAVSSHSKDPARSRNLEWEVAQGHKALDEVDALGAEEQYYLGGNHEDRLRRYLEDKAPELFGLVSIPDILQLKQRGYKYIPYKDHMKLGKLHFTHDVGNAGRYAAFKALDAYQHSIITGHSHRLSYIVEGNAVGEYKLSAQFGWLGDAKAVDYMHRAKVAKDWALGFGAGYLDPSSGFVYLTPVPIVNYSLVLEGHFVK